jgi:hypothetical protein
MIIIVMTTIMNVNYDYHDIDDEDDEDDDIAYC